MKVAIIGYGVVGQAMHRLFIDAYIYDVDRGTKEGVNKCDVAFICVPTPCDGDGPLDTTIVEEVISWCERPLIVIRSTLNPGSCDKLLGKYYRHICYQPEYLGESPAHPFADPRTRPFLILGGEPADRRKLIELYQTIYNANISIRQMTNYTAECVKLAENRAVAFRVAEAQELFDACEAAGVDYYEVREAVYGDDPRFSRYWTFVYPDKRGFNGKCLPKDVFAWKSWCESVGASAEVTRAILERNKELLSSPRSSPSIPESVPVRRARIREFYKSIPSDHDLDEPEADCGWSDYG